MAEQSYYGYDTPEAEVSSGQGISVFTSWIGGLVSVGLVVGLGVWGYRISVRDVTAVPVIRAMAGPMRVLPSDPGGETISYQGLAVNQVQAAGGVGAPPDTVVLAPSPVDLTPEDIAVAQLKPRVHETRLAQAPSNVRDVSAATRGPEANADSPQAAIDRAMQIAVSEAVDMTAVANVARLPGVKHSPRPRARVRVATLAPLLTGGAKASVTSSGSGPVATLPDSASTAALSAVDVDPASVVSGTFMVQLGAFDDRKTAIDEWNSIVGRQGDLIGGRKRYIQVAKSGGRSFYRLRMVGFSSLGDSRRLCSALLARGTPCIPVTAR